MTRITDKRKWQVSTAVLASVAMGVAFVAPASADSGTTSVTIKLTDSNGAPLSGGSAKYYGKANGSTASNWHDFGTTSADGMTTLAVTPGKITFQVTYKHTQQSKTVTVSGSDADVEFQTTPATVSLKDSQGTPIAGAAAQYYGTATAWQSMGVTDSDGNATAEVLPSAISFAVAYNGGREQQSKVAVDGPTTIDFQTKAVTLKLEDQNGNPLANGKFEHYGLATGGWVQHGLSGANGTIETELLNGSYTVHMTFDKKLQNATVVVAGDPAGHTFVAEVAAPVVPAIPENGDDDDNEGGNTPGGEDNQGNEGGNLPGNGEGGNEDGDGNLPDAGIMPVDDDPQVPPAIDTDVNDLAAVKPGSERPVTELHDDTLSSQAPTGDTENSDENATLAKTGSEATVAGGIGALLLLIGLGLVGASRRKNNA